MAKRKKITTARDAVLALKGERYSFRNMEEMLERRGYIVNYSHLSRIAKGTGNASWELESALLDLWEAVCPNR